MKKLICILACIIMTITCFVGCADKDVVDRDAENTQAIDVGNEYALYSNDNYYPVSNSFFVGGIFKNLETQYIKADDPFPAQNWYTGDGFLIKANIIEPNSSKGEAIWFINATKEGKTPRKVGIGDDLTTVMEAYDNKLFLEQNWIYDPTSGEPEFDKVYIYAPPSDGTTLYVAFFVSKGKVVMVEIADGFELRPYESVQQAEEIIQPKATEVDTISSKDDRKITLSMDQITSGEVSKPLVGGAIRYTLSLEELKEFIDIFNGCNITEEDCEEISGDHTAMSDSIDVILHMNNGTAIYYLAFSDGEIYVTNEYSKSYYSLYNTDLFDYISSMGEYLNTAQSTTDSSIEGQE